MSETEFDHPDSLPKAGVVRPATPFIIVGFLAIAGLVVILIFGVFSEPDPTEEPLQDTADLPEIDNTLPSTVESTVVDPVEEMQQRNMGDIIPADPGADSLSGTLDPPDLAAGNDDLAFEEPFDDPLGTYLDDHAQDRRDRYVDALLGSPVITVDVTMYDGTGEEQENAANRPTDEPPPEQHSQEPTYAINTGTIIPAALISGISSDLPGSAIAQVSKNVYDSTTGRVLLIPQGSKITGIYDTEVRFQQSRVMVQWNQITLPDGRPVELENMLGSDQAGFAGFTGNVNNRFWQMIGAAAMTSVIGAASTYGARGDEKDQNVTLGSTATSELSRQWGQLGQEQMRRYLDVKPTIEVEPGYQFSIIVTKKLELPLYTQS